MSVIFESERPGVFDAKREKKKKQKVEKNGLIFFFSLELGKRREETKKEIGDFCALTSNQSLKLHPESFSNNSLILGLQRRR